MVYPDNSEALKFWIFCLTQAQKTFKTIIEVVQNFLAQKVATWQMMALLGKEE